MSGGHFDYRQTSFAEMFAGQFRDAEIDALFIDLFGNGYYADCDSEFGRTWSNANGKGDGLVETLDLWLSDDISEETYRKQVARFKEKWLRRGDEGRLEFYLSEFDRRTKEMAETYRREFLCEVSDE